MRTSTSFCSPGLRSILPCGMAKRGVLADIYVFGGAAMALAYDSRRATRDVDALFKPHGIVLEEARAVAAKLGLPNWWLWLHRAVAGRLALDPPAVLAQVGKNLQHLKQVHPAGMTARWLDEWQKSWTAVTMRFSAP